MKKEDKDILYKDICARVPYNLCVEYNKKPYYLVSCTSKWVNLARKTSPYSFATDLGDIKPYLYPMSSITEEQLYEFYCRFVENEVDFDDFKTYYKNTFHKVLTSISDCYDVIQWFNKYHIDYNNLIPKGLAIDATNLNIY